MYDWLCIIASQAVQSAVGSDSEFLTERQLLAGRM